MDNEIDRHCYIILNNDMVSDGIKYEIGRIYKIPEENGTCYPRIFYGIDALDASPSFNGFDQDQKLFEVKILNFISKKPVNFKIIKKKNDGIYYFMAKLGFDEHLDIISQTSSDKETLEEVLKHERECDLWLKNKLKRDE
jgi:hypothetical protein